MAHECRIALAYKWRDEKNLPFNGRGHLLNRAKEAVDKAGAILKKQLNFNAFEIIPEQVISVEIPEWLFESCICIFELSSESSHNVWYEFGIARGTGKRCIPLCTSNRLPAVASDVSGVGVVVYNDPDEFVLKVTSYLLETYRASETPAGVLPPAARVHKDRTRLGLERLMIPYLDTKTTDGTFWAIGSSFRAVATWNRKDWITFLERGWSFRFYSISDNQARQRAIAEGALHEKPNTVERLVREKKSLVTTIEGLGPLAIGKVEVFEYDYAPTLHVTVINDERYYVNPYPPASDEGMSAPVFEFYGCPLLTTTSPLAYYKNLFSLLKVNRIWPK